MQELSGTGTVLANLLTGLGIDEPFTRSGTAGTRTLLGDALNSTLALADDTGTVQTSYTYEPFGTSSVTGQSNTNSYQYTGRENDGTGLDYYRARYYYPSRQRFISEDPLDFDAGDINLYAYVFNAPVNDTDPTGEVVPIIAGAVACGAGAIGGVAVVLSGRKPTLGRLATGAGVGCAGGLLVLGGVAVAGVATASAAAEKGAEFLLSNWYRSTFFSTSGTVAYHWMKHAQRYGKTAVEYTKDAVDFFQKNQQLGKPATLGDGTVGVLIRTKGPGGYFTPDGRVVTFWYR